MTENPLFEPFKGRIEDLFIPERQYTFLVGAGASMDSPTNFKKQKTPTKEPYKFLLR
ncbi:MAG: hypothetical protein ACTSP6_08430 [Promethearchaeota archaeon]